MCWLHWMKLLLSWLSCVSVIVCVSLLVCICVVGPFAYATWSESKSEWSVTFYEKSSNIEARLQGFTGRAALVGPSTKQDDL